MIVVNGLPTENAVGAVYDRAVFPRIKEIRAVIDRAYSRFAVTWTRFFQRRRMGPSRTNPFPSVHNLNSPA
jgi:hypothetical protein